MKVMRPACWGLWVLWWCALSGGAAAQPSAADYARDPDIRGAVVSPSNSHVALLMTGPKGRVVLAVAALADMSQRRVIAAYDDVDITEVTWVNDRRLVYSAQQPGTWIEYDKWGSLAVDVDGSNQVHLISARSGKDAPTGSSIRPRSLERGWDYWRAVGDGSDDVLVTRWLDSLERGFRPKVVARVNTRTLALKPLSDGQPDGADAWLFDAEGRLRVVTTDIKDRSALWWRPRPEGDWEKVHEWESYGGDALQPVALEADGTLIVASRRLGDTTALFTFDLQKKHFDPEPLVAVDGFDVDGVIFDRRQQRVAGVPVQAQRPTWVWFDEGLARAQATVDKALPGRSNRLLCGSCIGAERFVVVSASDRQSSIYYVFDAKAGKLAPLAASRPWISEATQGRRSFHRVAARDGLSLPVVVTHPPGVPEGEPAPTVVLVHGGPWVPGATTLWDDEAQFLATRGYRVLEISYRGTTGLGWKHHRASWGEFGLAMQDDLEDGLLWAVAEKLTDPDRVCIYGASYGGYAALMGPVRHANRYRCAVSHVGVTDLTLMFSRNWTDVSVAGRVYGYKRLIGDPDTEAEKLHRQSPVNRVAEIKVPLLVAQGRLDRRVSPEHADRFVGAARAAGVQIERVDYDEGHGFANAESRADFWQRLEAFLARHLARAPR